MKTVLALCLAAAALAGCQNAVTDAEAPKRNNSASDFANVVNESHARDRVVLQHGNADRP